MKIVLATNNRHKVEEIQEYFKDLEMMLISGDIKLQEEGATLRDNALQKARAVAKTTGEWALADDTGLFVEALDGRPGIFSARYAGENASYEQNVQKLLEEMKEIPAGNRGAYFSCVMALVHPDGQEVTAEGRLEGTIALAPQGSGGFGYDPIFFLPGRGCTLAQISLEEKNKISHRGRALGKTKSVIEGLVKLEKRFSGA